MTKIFQVYDDLDYSARKRAKAGISCANGCPLLRFKAVVIGKRYQYIYRVWWKIILIRMLMEMFGS